jgi:NAD-dependent SIR2 family protein deacetylase
MPMPLTTRAGSWNYLQDALSSFRQKARQIAAPPLAERQALLGGGTNEARFEALVHGLVEQRFGNNIIVLAGAGISVAAGFPDFRDKESGVYAKIKQKHGMVNPENIFTVEEYERNPGPLCIWLQEFLGVQEKAVPTVTHLFLKMLEEKGVLLRCYTQNIDGLELAAGLPRERVVMAHGDMAKPRCVSCGETCTRADFEEQVRAGKVPFCQKSGCGGPVRPDIVFFSEPTRIPHDYQRDFDACDLLIIIGTSLNVNPFANLAARVPVMCPRMLINSDKVLISGCRHKSRQLKFDTSKAYRDVWVGGLCDESIRVLSSRVGWDSHLLKLEAEIHGLVPPSVSSASVPNQASADMVVLQTPPHSSAAFDGDSSASDYASAFDKVSVLSDSDLATAFRTSPISSHSTSFDTGLPHVASGGSMASMVSELSTTSEVEMDLVDEDTGNRIRL